MEDLHNEGWLTMLGENNNLGLGKAIVLLLMNLLLGVRFVSFNRTITTQSRKIEIDLKYTIIL